MIFIIFITGSSKSINKLINTDKDCEKYRTVFLILRLGLIKILNFLLKQTLA